jgi:hypothetical protein
VGDKERYAERRAVLRQRYGSLYEFVLELLFEVDPAGINFETNTDEYEPEVDTILPRLQDDQTVDDLQRIVHEEFTRWFGAETAGTVDNYLGVARRLHSELERRRLS